MDRDPHLSPNSEALSDAHKIYELFIHVNTRIFLNSTDFYSPAISLLFGLSSYGLDAARVSSATSKINTNKAIGTSFLISASRFVAGWSCRTR